MSLRFLKLFPILASAMLAMSISARAATVAFTNPDFSNGALSGQQGWVAEGSWIVGDAAGAGNASTSTQNEIALLNSPIVLSAGQSYGFTINLQLTGSVAAMTGSAFTYVFQAGLKQNSTATGQVLLGDAVSADATIQYFSTSTGNGGDDYRLLNNFTAIGSTITSGLDAGDILEFEYNITLGADAASTSYTVRLQNLTDATDTGVGTVTGIDVAMYSALTGAGGYLFMQSTGFNANSSGISGIQVNSVEIASIPEPSLGALFALGSLGLMLRRRRK
ncbi:MAG: PEP-CTERM sorting domain-containing protein [Verrucomicrobiales bacterium]|nr:PEP-CTERM sorting domain-containing protein [Verrucomicrobiales bacterium]